MNAWVGIKLSCLVALMGHLAITIHDKLNPKGTITITEKIKLDRIDFPAIFKVCILPSFNKTELKKVGYNSPFDYFNGQSRYNTQRFGWSGHTKEGQPFSNASDVQKRIFLDYHSVINFTYVGLSHNASREYFSLPTSNYKLEPNYPNNCLALDIANIPDVKGKIVDKMVIGFNTNTFVTEVNINLVDRLKLTKRHYMYSKLSYKGPTVYLDDFTEPQTKTCLVSFKQDIYLEADKSKDCVVYPTDKFLSYKDCDHQFLADLLKKEILHPAWATPEDLNKATNISQGAGLNEETGSFFYGDLHNPCTEPCKETSFHSYYSFTEYGVVSGWKPSLLLDLNPVVEVTWHVFPSYDVAMFLLDLGSCSVEYPYNTTCDNKTSTTHFLVPFCILIGTFFWAFFSMSGNFLTPPNMKNCPKALFDSSKEEF